MGTRMQEYWRAARKFGVGVQAPYRGTLADGTPFESDALIEGFGSPIGTVIFSFNADPEFLRQIQAAGYSYSLMREPSDRTAFTEASELREVLLDWEWRGDPDAMPAIVAATATREDEET